MDIDFNPAQRKYQRLNTDSDQFVNKFNKNKQANSDEELKEVVNEFTSIFLNQMFKSMRSTVPEGGLIDGGFAEDVFTDMYDQEISKLGSKDNSFNSLNQILFEQLSQNNS